jgi:hypothetical protein
MDCQNLPKDWEEKQTPFRDYTRDIIDENKIDLDQVANMDKMTIKTTGHEKARFSHPFMCNLWEKIAANAYIQEKDYGILKEKFLPGVVIAPIRKDGWMRKSRMIGWTVFT